MTLRGPAEIQQGIGAGGAALTAIGVAKGAAWVPLVGPIIAGVSLGIGLLLGRKGPKQKRAATEIVNDLEPLLKQNLDAYLAGPRTRTNQAAALANFDQAWEWLTGPEGLGNPALGEPGRRGISERSAGGRWDWFAYYRDPIATDADVRDEVFGLVLPPGQTAGDVAAWFIPAALVIGALAL